MKVTKLNKIEGTCSKCKMPLSQGYLYQSNNGEAFKILCESCFLAEQQQEKTIQHITVKEEARGFLAFIFSLFGVETKIYRILSCEDPSLGRYITASELVNLQKRGDKIKIYK